MRYLSVCSGIEAATVAWHPLGWPAAAYSEIEAFPRAVLAHHYPDTPCHGDFTTIGADEYGPIDLLVGGTPCQSFSIAGLRGGLADDRGNLALEFLKLARRKRARWVVWENVPGAFSAVSHPAPDFSPPDIDLDAGNGPRDGEEVVVEDRYDSDENHAFACFLAGLSELGYGWAYRVLDAQYAGVPQRRRREFVVGYLGDWRRAAAVLFERHSLQGNPAPRRETGQVAPTVPSRSSAGGGLGTDFDCDGGLIQSFAQIGNGEYRPGVGTMRASGGDCHGGSETLICPDVAGTLKSCGGKSGSQNGAELIDQLVAHSLRGEGFDASEDGTGRGVPLIADTLTSNGDAHSGYRDEKGLVAFSIMPMNSGKDYKARETDVAQPIMAGGPVGGNQGGDFVCAFQSSQSGVREVEAHATLDSNNGSRRHNGIATESAVRRLTPRECERLQGFPDDYTAVPYRGKPAADGPRYKALGNSMAVPVMRWIGERIAAVDALSSERLAA